MWLRLIAYTSRIVHELSTCRRARQLDLLLTPTRVCVSSHETTPPGAHHVLGESWRHRVVCARDFIHSAIISSVPDMADLENDDSDNAARFYLTSPQQSVDSVGDHVDHVDPSYKPKVLKVSGTSIGLNEYVEKNQAKILVLYSGGTIGMRSHHGGEYLLSRLDRHWSRPVYADHCLLRYMHVACRSTVHRSQVGGGGGCSGAGGERAVPVQWSRFILCMPPPQAGQGHLHAGCRPTGRTRSGACSTRGGRRPHTFLG